MAALTQGRVCYGHVSLTGFLSGVYPTGVHPVGVYLIGMHSVGVPLIGVPSHRYASHGVSHIGHAFYRRASRRCASYSVPFIECIS
jgi:hypothetical protein